MTEPDIMPNSDDPKPGPPGRRFFNSREGILAAVLLALCAAVLLFRGYIQNQATSSSATARIFLDGEPIRELQLWEEDNYRIALMPDYGVPVSFEVRGGQIRFVEVDCPDHTCERTGFLSETGQTAACLPNRVVLLIE